MKVKALQEFFIPNQGGFEPGAEYEVSDLTGATLVERGLVEEVKPTKKKTEESKTSNKAANK